MANFKETVRILKSKLDAVNRLLDIESLEEMSDDELLAAGVNTSYSERIYQVTFEDGSTLDYYLCSGTTNYYDDVYWTSPDGSREVVFDCEYCLASGENGYPVDDDLYSVVVEVVDDEAAQFDKYEEFVEHFWGDN